MARQVKTHVLNDAARMLRKAARTLDTLADNLVADVSPKGSTRYAINLAENNINAALARMASFKD